MPGPNGAEKAGAFSAPSTKVMLNERWPPTLGMPEPKFIRTGPRMTPGASTMKSLKLRPFTGRLAIDRRSVNISRRNVHAENHRARWISYKTLYGTFIAGLPKRGRSEKECQQAQAR